MGQLLGFYMLRISHLGCLTQSCTESGGRRGGGGEILGTSIVDKLVSGAPGDVKQHMGKWLPSVLRWHRWRAPCVDEQRKLHCELPWRQWLERVTQEVCRGNWHTLSNTITTTYTVSTGLWHHGGGGITMLWHHKTVASGSWDFRFPPLKV